MKRRTRVLLLALLAGVLALPDVPASAEDPAPSVTLTADRSSYTARDNATFTSHITAANLDFALFVQTPGSSDWKLLNTSVNVNTGDTQTNTLTVYYNVKVLAELIDDNGTPNDSSDDTVKASQQIDVFVRAQMATGTLSYFAKSGNYAVFARGSSPTFRSYSFPGFPGKRCLRHVVQRHYASGWKNVLTTACRVEGKQGRVDWRWAGKHASRVNFRVRATFAGDAVNLPSAGHWFYFRFH